MALSGRMSLVPAARRVFPGNAPGNLLQQARFVMTGMREWPLAVQLMEPPAGSALERITRNYPQMIGALCWPYISASFDAGERLRRIIAHYQAIDALGPPFDFGGDERLVLADLGELMPGLRLVLDQPVWFLREGGLTLNLFIDSFRAFSIAFSFRREADGRLTAWIGGIQGRNRDDMLETYRNLTKLIHGLRPRDFLLEAFRMLCRRLEVSELWAVSDAARHHRHPYFRGAVKSSTNYDEIWLDRGGVAVDKDFFQLPLAKERRDEATIKPNKRPMYRRRFELLDALEAEIGERLPTVQPTRFEDS